MTREEQVKKIKILVSDKSIDEDLLSLYADMITQRVLNYCHREDVPSELELIIVQMVAEYCNLKFAGGEMAGDGSDAVGGSVKAITRGDTRIEYGSESADTIVGTGSSEMGVREFVSNYERQLNAFRKLVTR